MFRKIVAFLHARAKAALIQPQSEREAVLTGREPPQGNGAFCENRRGVRLPCRRCRPSSGLSLKPHPYLALDKADGIATLTLGTVEPPPWARSRDTKSVFCARAFFFSVWIDVVPLAARGTLWYNFSP